MSLLHSNVIGSGEDLIVLHGFLGMSDNWKTLGAKFAEQGFRVHLLDQRNHGRSFHSNDFSYEIMVNDLMAYMDANKIEKTAILGHSMGGKTAMFATCMQPNRFTRLLVADIAPKSYEPHHHEIINALLALDKENLTSRSQADELLAQHIKNWGIRQFLLKNLYRENKEELRFRFNLPVLSDQMETIGKSLPETYHFSKPTLFLRGGNSDYILEADHHKINHHFSQAKIKSIPNTGHWLHAEAPDVFFKLSLEFLK